MEDERVKHTSVDAAACKMSAVRCGYFKDDLIDIFSQATVRKMPLINRGTYARTECISGIVRSFLAVTAAVPCSIVVLGAGLDSLSLNIMRANTNPLLSILDVDFKDVVRNKVRCMHRDREKLAAIWPSWPTFELPPALSMQPPGRSSSDAEFVYGNIRFFGCDLRSAAEYAEILAHADPRHPTLFISECVLVYLSKPDASELCAFFGSHYASSLWATYDMVYPNDRFGQIMQQNIAAAGYAVPGFFDYPDLLAQESRFLVAHFNEARSITMKTAYYRLISTEEQRRVSRVEMFDEIEEWHMLMDHYSLTLALRGEHLRTVFHEFVTSASA